MLESWYMSVLSDMSTVKKESVESASGENVHIECYCVKTPRNSTLVICAMCNKGQHAKCVHFEPKPFQEIPFLCANCWTLNDKLQCKATLVVVPSSIVNQWINEVTFFVSLYFLLYEFIPIMYINFIQIDKHIAKPGLKVLIYNGVQSDGYIQPFNFNDYDVVITSYTNLSKDLKYLGCVSKVLYINYTTLTPFLTKFSRLMVGNHGVKYIWFYYYFFFIFKFENMN